MKQKVIERIGEGPNRKGRKSSGEEGEREEGKGIKKGKGKRRQRREGNKREEMTRLRK